MTEPSPRKPAFLALVRHARARRPFPGESDAERELTEEGRRELEGQCARLAALHFGCDRLWTSPLLRARQTAERLAALCGVEAVVHAGLGSELDTAEGRALIAEASALARTSRVVLVGHQPWLAELARALGARRVQELDCAEILWLAREEDGGFRVASRLVAE